MTLPVTFTSAAPLAVGGKPFRGRIVVSLDGKALQAVDVVSLEAYLKGVVPSEMPSDWPAGRTSGPGGRGPLLRAREPRPGTAVRPLRRLAQPGLRRHRRRVAVDERRGRRDERAGRALRGRRRRHALLLDLGRPHRLCSRAARHADPVPRLRRRSLRHDLALPRLGPRAVRHGDRRPEAEGRAGRWPTSRSRPGRRAASRPSP